MREARLKSTASVTLANKLQKLLMLSPYRRLVLSKIAHLGPDLGLLPNFRSRLCNEHPEKFKIVDTSYGHALELVSWGPIPSKSIGKRIPKNSVEAEKRACSVVREILGMTTEKRTLIDHLTHFRKDFGLPNKLRAMLVRHPELFYVSLKGHRDSVFLVEAYDDNGELIQKDEGLIIKDQLFELVRQGKRIRKERRLDLAKTHPVASVERDLESFGDVNEDDELDDLFDWDDSDFEIYDEVSDEEYNQPVGANAEPQFWISEGLGRGHGGEGDTFERW
ncbi:Protein WHAT'S THIS FACTOR 1-like protein [Bienertia sinuspersici]